MALEDLYKEVILDHYKNPRNKRALPGAELSCSKNNPLCGDEITVNAHLEDGRVAEVTFEGSGCSISQASASMLTEAVERGARVDDAEALAGASAPCWPARSSPTRTSSATWSRSRAW